MSPSNRANPMSSRELEILRESIRACSDLAQLEGFERSMQRLFPGEMADDELPALFAVRRRELSASMPPTGEPPSESVEP